MEKNNQIVVLKTTLAETVNNKQETTKERVAYKKSTPISEPSRRQELNRLWSQSRGYKNQIRTLALAYAFLRGARYWEVERNTKKPNVSASAIAAAAGNPGLKDEVALWMAVKPSEEESKEFAKHLAEAAAKVRQGRKPFVQEAA